MCVMRDDDSEFFKVQSKPFHKDALVSSTSLCFWWDTQCSSASVCEEFPGIIQQMLGIHWHTSRVNQVTSQPYSFPPLLYSLCFFFPYLYVWFCFFPVLSHFHLLSSALAREARKVMQAWIICSNRVFVFCFFCLFFAVCRNLRNLQWNTRMPTHPGPKCILELRDASIQRKSIGRIKKRLMEMSFSIHPPLLYCIGSSSSARQLASRWSETEIEGDNRLKRERRGIWRPTWEHLHGELARGQR